MRYPDLSTNIYHLHQGVHFAFDPSSAASQLVNGRELTAADVVFTFNRFNGLAGYKSSRFQECPNESPDIGHR